MLSLFALPTVVVKSIFQFFLAPRKPCLIGQEASDFSVYFCRVFVPIF